MWMSVDQIGGKQLICGLSVAASLLLCTAAMQADESNEPVSQEMMELGREVYYRPGSCAGCHGEDGEGSTYVPPFANEDMWLKRNPDRIVKILYHGYEGFIRVNGNGYDGDMPAHKGMLTNKEMAAVLTYIRNDFGNSHGPISEDFVTKVIEETGERDEPWHLDALLGRTGELPKFDYKPETLLRPEPGKALTYRHHVEGTDARSVSVGFGDGLNYAYDLRDFNISLLWRDEFINAGRHWDKRAKGNTEPAGSDVVGLKNGLLPFAVLSGPDDAWPTYENRRQAGYRFRGYELDERTYPVFRYEWRGITVEDKLEPVDGKLVRSLSLETSERPEKILYLAAAHAAIDQTDSGYRIGDTYTLAALGDDAFVRRSGDQQQVLKPVEFKKSGDKWVATISQSYSW